MEKIVLQGRGVFSGKAEGYALVCPASIDAWNGIHLDTGVIKDFKCVNKGKSIKGTILVLPASKGSNGWSIFFSATKVSNVNPAGWLISEIDSASAVAIAGLGIPAITDFAADQNPCQIIADGDYVSIDGDSGQVEIIKSSLLKTNVKKCDGVYYIGGQLPDMSENPSRLSFKEQAKAVFKGLELKAKNLNTSLDNALMNYIHISDMAYLDEMNEVYDQFFKGDKPTRITVEAKGFPAGTKIIITSLIAEKAEDKQVFRSKNPNFCSDIGATATIHNGIIRLNGMIPMDGKSGQIIKGHTTDQARAILANIQELLEEMGSSMANVLHVNSKVGIGTDFGEYIKGFHEYFDTESEHPARVASIVNIWEDLALELSITAAVNKADKQVFRSPNFKALSTPSYPSVNISGNTIFLSGIISNDKQTGALIESDLKTELDVCFDNLKSVLSDLGSDFSDVLMLDIYTTEDSDADYQLIKDLVNEVFDHNPPAVAIIYTKQMLANLKVEFGTFAALKQK